MHAPKKLQWRTPRDHPSGRSVEAEAGLRLGLEPATVHCFLYSERGWFARLVELTQLYRALGALDRLQPLFARLDAARRPLQLVPLDQALDAEAMADAREDISEIRFLRDRSDAALDEAIRDQDLAILRSTVLRDALVHEQQSRRGLT